MNFNFKRDKRIIEGMIEGLEDIDIGEVLGDWRVASMDRQMREAKMSREERDKEIMQAFDTTLAFEII